MPLALDSAPSLLVTSWDCVLGLLLQGRWGVGRNPFATHMPSALDKTGTHPEGLPLLGQEESETVCQEDCWPV